MAKKRHSAKIPDYSLHFDDTLPPVTFAEREQFFKQMLRDRELFDLVSEHLTTHDFRGAEDGDLLLLLRACQEVRSEFDVKPGDPGFRPHLRTRVDQILASDAVEIEFPEADLYPLIDAAFAAKKSEFDLGDGISTLKRILQERHVYEPLKDILSRPRLKEYPKDLGSVIDQVQVRLNAINTIGADDFPCLGAEWKEYKSRQEQRRKRELIGLKTGVKDLDKRTLGVRGFVVIGARPGVGKTTFSAVQVAIGIGRHHEINDAVVVVLSLDMDRFEIYARLECNLAGLDWSVLTQGSPKEQREPGKAFSQAHMNLLTQAKVRMEEEEIWKRLVVIDRTQLGDDVSAGRLRRILDREKRRVKASHAILIIDYLQLLPVPDDVADRGENNADKYRVRLVQEIIEGSRSKENPYGDTVLAISEARKPPTSKDEWGQSLSELIGSSRLPYAADAVILYRSMRLDEIIQFYGVAPSKSAAAEHRKLLEQSGISPVVLTLEKGRDGMMRGDWSMEFHFRQSKFRPCPVEPLDLHDLPKPHLSNLVDPDVLAESQADSDEVPLVPSPSEKEQPASKPPKKGKSSPVSNGKPKKGAKTKTTSPTSSTKATTKKKSK